jgi:putative ABC transport system permease protein
MKNINIKLVFRTLYRNKMYTLLNILGLSIGMASAILILLWVQFQMSFDKFHKNTDNIYRVIQDQFYTNGEVFHVQVTPTGLSKVLKENIANIIHSTRYNNQQFLIKINDIKVMEEIHLVDADFLQIFSFPLIIGDPKKVLENAHSMIISEKMAEKYFGKKNPVGQIVMLEGKYPFTINGIIKNNPKNSEIWYNFLIPFEFYKELGINVESFNNNWISTYVQLSPGTSEESGNKSIEAYKKKHFPKALAVFFLQPLKKMHLYSIYGGGPIKNVKLFSLIALLIILIAAINFTNLSTAMAGKRFKEIGVKKVFGAGRRNLLRQFFSETLILSFIALFFALMLAESLLPWYNSLLKTDLKLFYLNWKLMVGIISISIVTGILSGTYPAVLLSAFRPVKILKGPEIRHKRSLLREVLVVLQFSLAIVLIVNTIIIEKQREYMKNKELGVQKDNILYVPIRGDLKKKFELFKVELLNAPTIRNVCLSSHLPAGIWSNGGDYKWQGKPPQVDPLVTSATVDFDYEKTFGLKMHEGKFYSDKQYIDTNNIVINKTFADIIGLKPIVGQILERGNTKFRIIGVTEDFNFKPLFSKIEPLAMYCYSENHNYIFIKISAGNIKQTIRKIEEIHNKFNSEFPFEYHFLDAEYDKMYDSEERQGKIFGYFSFLAIFISCLGLFGLASFMIAQRTKEIGIRKANGAGTLSIMMLFIKYYSRWVIISFIIATPVSYYFLKSWLENYAYKTALSWWIFALGGLIAFLIATFTVSWQSWKAANSNPVDALRYE